jgi:hypothetical protein
MCPFMMEDETDVSTFRKCRVQCASCRKQSSACYLLDAGFSLGFFFHFPQKRRFAVSIEHGIIFRKSERHTVLNAMLERPFADVNVAEINSRRLFIGTRIAV